MVNFIRQARQVEYDAYEELNIMCLLKVCGKNHHENNRNVNIMHLLFTIIEIWVGWNIGEEFAFFFSYYFTIWTVKHWFVTVLLLNVMFDDRCRQN